MVPIDKKTEVGYRPLLETDANLKKILAKLETNGKSTTKPPIEAVKAELQPIITMATIGTSPGHILKLLFLFIKYPFIVLYFSRRRIGLWNAAGVGHRFVLQRKSGSARHGEATVNNGLFVGSTAALYCGHEGIYGL